MAETDIIASRHLGSKSKISETYDKNCLVAIPRAENRFKYEIIDSKSLFRGFDVWHAYEFSVLTQNGLPVTRILKIKYSSDSEFIIESKSLKLYLNSFNMYKLGNSVDETLEICKSIIEKDLSESLKTRVEINFLDNTANRINLFSDFRNILELVNIESINIEEFKECPELLRTEDLANIREYFYTFDSLRSNCRVTHQPDFGDIFIYYKSKKHIQEDSLIKYLVSFRQEYHFHEECVEMIYKRLSDLLNKEDFLFICALYTRRGGIDISPVRWSNNFTPEYISSLIDLNKFARYGAKQ